MTEPPRVQPDGGDRLLIRSRVLRIAFGAVPIFVASALVRALVGNWRSMDDPSGVTPQICMMVLTFALYPGYVRLFERRWPCEVAGGVATATGEITSGLALGVALFGLTVALGWMLGAFRIEAGSDEHTAVPILVSSLRAAVVEEAIFRAILFRIAEERLGTHRALALSATLFGLLHAANPGATLFVCAAIAIEAGVLLAAAYLLTRRLWLPIGLHAGWNFAEGGLFGARISGHSAHGLYRTTPQGSMLLSGGDFGPEASLVALVVCSAAGVALLWGAWRRGHFLAPSR